MEKDEKEKRDLKYLLTKGLTETERQIVVLYYHEEMTMKEIGKALDLSEARVSQIHSSIIARLKAQMDSKNRGAVEEQTQEDKSENIEMSPDTKEETIQFFYKMCKGQMDIFSEKTGLEQFFREPITFEQSFWRHFITIALCTWDEDSKYEIKLREVFRVYLTIYCDEIDKNMRIEDEPSFLRLLKEKYDKTKKIWHETDDSRVALFLARLALGEKADGDIIKTILFSMDIIRVMNVISPLPYNLIEEF